MRIFIGIPFKDKDKERLQKIQKTVKEKSEGGRFAEPENFHLTLKFIGEIQEEKIQAISEVIKKAAGEVPPFKMVLQGFGVFRKGKTCIPWLGVQEGQEGLGELQGKIEGGLEEIGFKKESRPFQPHMTFGRKVQLSSSEETYLQEVLKKEQVSMEVTSVAIMESTRIEGKLVYPVIHECSLSK